MRQVGDAEAKRLIVGHHGLESGEIHVRTLASTWAPLNTVLLPGDLLSKEDFGGKQQGLLIDADYHRVELPVLRALGATDRPVAEAGSAGGNLDRPVRRSGDQDAVEHGRKHGARIKPEHFALNEPPAFGGPVTPLAILKPDAAARYAKELLAVSPDLSPWTLRRSVADRRSLGTSSTPALEGKEIARIPTDRGVRPIADCISPLAHGLCGSAACR